LYTAPFHKPTSSEQSLPVRLDPSIHACTVADIDSTATISHLTREQLCLLWHQCLGHLHSRRLSDMHKYANGVPAVSFATTLDHCAVCAKAKLHKAARGIAST